MAWKTVITGDGGFRIDTDGTDFRIYGIALNKEYIETTREGLQRLYKWASEQAKGAKAGK